jgi:hypothetical protein
MLREKIATSPKLRSLLASSSLRNTLIRLSSIPRYSREPSLRVLLSLPSESSPNQYYRPDPSKKFQTGFTTKEEERFNNHNHKEHSPNYRGRGRGRGGGGGGGGYQQQGRGVGTSKLLESTPEERKEMEAFAKEVRRVLEEVRDKKG